MEYSEFRSIPHEIINKATIIQYFNKCIEYLDKINSLKDVKTSFKIRLKLINNSQYMQIESLEDFENQILPNDDFESFELYISKFKEVGHSASYFLNYDSYENEEKYKKHIICKRKIQISFRDKVWVNETANHLQKWFEETLNPKNDSLQLNDISLADIDRSYKINKIGVVATILGTVAAVVGLLISLLKKE